MHLSHARRFSAHTGDEACRVRSPDMHHSMPHCRSKTRQCHVTVLQVHWSYTASDVQHAIALRRHVGCTTEAALDTRQLPTDVKVVFTSNSGDQLCILTISLTQHRETMALH